MSEAESINTKLTDFSAQLSKQERKAFKEEYKLSKESSFDLFSKASLIFVDIGLKKQAA